MKGVARMNDRVGPDAIINHVPSTGVLVNGQNIAVLNSGVSPHQHGNQTVIAFMAEGCSTVTAGGQLVCREGDAASHGVCGHTILVGSPNVKVP